MCAKPVQAGPRTSYCSARCRSMWSYTTRKQAGRTWDDIVKQLSKEQRSCEVCGTPFAYHPKQAVRFCSRRCTAESRIIWGRSEVVPWAACLVCRGWFVARRRRACSVPSCQQALRRRWYQGAALQRPEVYRPQRRAAFRFPCLECGDAVDAAARVGDKRRVFCGQRCCRRWHKRLRKVRLRGAYVEPVGLREIAERDEWRCHICRRKVRPSMASLDHLVPLARGGSHTRANVALAHWMCNTKRGCDRLPAQLRLVG